MNKICGIYKITNLINGKIYIGKSVNIEGRWKKEKKCPPNEHIKSSFNKYGILNFKFEIFHICEKEMLNDFEIYFISYY